MNRRSFCIATLPVALSPALVRAQAPFPSKPIRIISAYAAGGGPDVQLRQFAPVLSELLGQSVVVENKVGAAGVLAAQFVAGSAPDGYTLGMGSNTHLIQKALQPSLKFDPIADFVPVTNMVASPTVLVVSVNSPWQTAQELVAAARTAPGSMNYGSGGIGTSAHLAGASFVSFYGLKATHVPFKGSVEIPASLMRGDTQFAFPVAGTGVPQVKGGRLRALAVTSARRLSQLPDVPTLREVMNDELGVQESWFGIWAPAGTPEAIVNRLHAASSKALADHALRAAFENAGTIAAPSESPRAFAAFMASEVGKWSAIVRMAEATPS